MKITARHYIISFCVTLLAVVICGILIPKVNVNSDMTKYLPDSSRMKAGMEILSSEFGRTGVDGGDVKVMFSGLDDSLRLVNKKILEQYPDVSAVSCRVDEVDGTYTLYELTVPKSVDQKRLGQDISRNFGDEVIVETAQDGATPPVSVLIIAGSLILIILLIMAESWIEPLLFMLSTGLAVIINIGSNAFLSSVSITTNYIVAILQLVLSLDYSIILMSRYRQERAKGLEPIRAINRAIRRAAPSIMSSAMTTVVGLLMLCFMNLKIGADMGIVLAKGVVCSLVCNFTAFPAIILAFDKVIFNTAKKAITIPTDALARFSTKYRVPLVIFFLIVFFGSYFLHNRTVISFSTNGESRIQKVFPEKNLTVLLYGNDDEDDIIPFADSLRGIDGVESVISYPTLLRKQYKADEMVDAIKGMPLDMGGGAAMPNVAGMLTPEMLRLAYYFKFNQDDDIKIEFPDLAHFISETCANSPLMESEYGAGMKDKLGLLDELFGTGDDDQTVEEVPETEVNVPAQTSTTVQTAPSTETKPAETTAAKQTDQVENPVVSTPVKSTPDGISIIKFSKKLASERSGEENVRVLQTLVDVPAINRQMTVQEISQYVGSTAGQTRIVFSFSKKKSKTMSPLEYVHFLSDDLFNRKSLSSMVSADQKKGLRARMKIMDAANVNAKLKASEIARMMTDLGISGITESYVKDMMTEQPAPSDKPATTTKPSSSDPAKPSRNNNPVADTAMALASDSLVAVVPDSVTVTAPDSLATPVADSLATVSPATDSLAVAADSTARISQSVQPEPVAIQPTPAPAKPVKTIDEIRADLIYDMMYSGKKYSATQMAKNFKRLGEDIDPEIVKLLYSYYGSVNNYDESWEMTIEDLLTFMTDDVLNDDRFSMFIDDETRASLNSVSGALDQARTMLIGPEHSMAIIVSNLPDESERTYEYIDSLDAYSSRMIQGDTYTVGESVMFSEMKHGFSREMLIITLLTILAIFTIVAISFRSLIVPVILVMTVMSGVFVNVVFSGFGGTMLYLAYLIAQSILMGATIDYGILFANYYREKRLEMDIPSSVREAYKGSIHTILTSGLIMSVAPGVMSLLVDDVAISAIVGCISVGAFAAVLLILLVVPGLLAAFDRLVVRSAKAYKEKED